MPYLERVAAFVPETTMSVQELAGPLNLGRSQQRLFTRFLGLDRIAVAGDLELADLLTEAGERALGDTDRDDVTHLVHTHTMQHVAVGRPHLLEEVRQRLRLRNASTFGMSHINCVVGLYGLHLARCLLIGAPAEHKVLLLCGDQVITHDSRLIPDITIQGDAAAACLIGHDPRGARVRGRALRVLGSFYQGIDCPDELQNEYKKIYVDELSAVMKEAVADAGCAPTDISLVLPHNVNRISWNRISRDVGIPSDRVYLENLPKTGHCYSADPFINLASARCDGRLATGDLVLLATAGLGAAFAATVIEIGEENR